MYSGSCAVLDIESKYFGLQAQKAADEDIKPVELKAQSALGEIAKLGPKAGESSDDVIEVTVQSVVGKKIQLKQV